ncbi:substrate-binding domain-containing protein [Rhizobium rhizogenes]|uniref:substrate-binding domain-containing protein n=1 Tax=Rhizobium rhizogenes TaxID=359 RepID=UPI00157414E6
MITRRNALTLMGAAGLLPLAAKIGVAATKPVKVGAAVYGLKNEYAQIWATEIKKHPAFSNGLAELTVFDGNYDHATQASQFDLMVTQKYDVAIYIPIDSYAAKGVIHKAALKGLPVVGSNGPAKSDEQISFIGSDDVAAGQYEAEVLFKAIGGKGKIVVLIGPEGNLGQEMRTQGNKKALDENKDIVVLERKTANWSRSEAMVLMQNWLTSHKGQIQGVLAQNDEMGLGAIAAMKAAGIDPKTIPVVGIDGVSDAVRAVKNGEMILSIRQDAHTQAQGAVDIALRKVLGESYKPLSDCWALYPQMPWGDGTAKLYPVPWTYVTAENADKFLGQKT